jgi:tRNA(Ile)-lysidine synthase
MGGQLHPAVAAVRRAVRTSCADLEPGQRVIVACSGGADSMALAAAAAFESRATGWLVGAAVVDHQLQAGSADVAVEVRERLLGLRCDPVEILTVSVGARGGPEGAARAARYDALAGLAADGEAVVLLGHTLDDQAETVLLGLARGSGLRSLAGMATERSPFRRPFLGITRRQTQDACRAMGLTVWDDPHNSDTRYARVRVRREALPVLERTLGPGVAEALARTAELARIDADALDTLAVELTARARVADTALSVEVLQPALVAVRRRALRRWVINAGSPPGDLTAGHVEAIDRLITHWHGQQAVHLPGPATVCRRAGELQVDLERR